MVLVRIPCFGVEYRNLAHKSTGSITAAKYSRLPANQELMRQTVKERIVSGNMILPHRLRSDVMNLLTIAYVIDSDEMETLFGPRCRNII